MHIQTALCNYMCVFCWDQYSHSIVPVQPFSDGITILEMYANSTDPFHMPMNMTFDPSLHSLLTGISMQNKTEHVHLNI